VSGKALMIALGSVIWFFDVFFASIFPYLLTVRIPYFAEFFNINFLENYLKLMRGPDLKEDSEDSRIIKSGREKIKNGRSPLFFSIYAGRRRFDPLCQKCYTGFGGEDYAGEKPSNQCGTGKVALP
jgi:hypothetical protein